MSGVTMGLIMCCVYLPRKLAMPTGTSSSGLRRKVTSETNSATSLYEYSAGPCSWKVLPWNES
jgi:hypothetical protein